MPIAGSNLRMGYSRERFNHICFVFQGYNKLLDDIFIDAGYKLSEEKRKLQKDKINSVKEKDTERINYEDITLEQCIAVSIILKPNI